MAGLDSSITPSLQLRIGRLLFALAVIGSGIYQLVTARYVNLVPMPPGQLPATWKAYLFGVLLVLIGGAFLIRRTIPAAAIMLAALLLVVLIGFGLPLALSRASTGFVWVGPLMTLTLLGGVCLTIDRVAEKAMRIVPLVLGAFLAYCGALHFVYTESVANLIPPWIPAHRFWTYFAAVALIAGGIGVVIPRTARIAATLSGIMLFSWVFLVHIPLAINTHTVSEVSRGLHALADSAVAFMLAGMLRGHES